MRRELLAGGDEEEGGPYDCGCGGLKHPQLLAIPHEQGRERGKGASHEAGCATAEQGYKTQDPPDHKDTYQDAEDAQGGVAFGCAKPAEERLPIVECQVVDWRMLVLAQLDGVWPDVSGAEPCPVERDGLVEPDAVVLKPPEARQGSQEEHDQFG